MAELGHGSACGADLRDGVLGAEDACRYLHVLLDEAELLAHLVLVLGLVHDPSLDRHALLGELLLLLGGGGLLRELGLLDGQLRVAEAEAVQVVVVSLDVLEPLFLVLRDLRRAVLLVGVLALGRALLRGNRSHRLGVVARKGTEGHGRARKGSARR